MPRISFHENSGGLRTTPLPSAEIDAAGNVYVGWEHCRFEAATRRGSAGPSSAQGEGVAHQAIRRD